MLGLNELGIELKWKFEFLNYGATVVSQPGTIFVDLGNKLDYGIIDHHFKGSKYLSSFSALTNNAYYVVNHLLGPINDSYYRGQKLSRNELVFTYVTHKFPDWDGMVSFYACDYMIRHGSALPEQIADALSEATDLIDQGKSKTEGKVLRPFLLFQMMPELKLPWEEQLLKGKMLIEQVLIQNKGKITSRIFLDEIVPPPDFYPETKLLEEDYSIFKKDLLNSRTFSIFLPTTDNQAVETRVFAFLNQPKCRLHKFWIRETTNTGLLLVPFENEQKVINRVIISVKPEDKLTLHCLGYELEKAETTKRKLLGKIRGGEPRFEKEYCDNADPWYDGRGHNYTIIDSPNAGTVLDPEEIIGIIRDLYSKPEPYRFNEQELDAFISYRREGGSDIAWAVNTLLTGKGKKVFLDVNSLQTGKFDEQLISHIQQSRNFLIILAQGTLDRCTDRDDWVLKEIQEAYRMKKKIIPLIKPGFKEPHGSDLPAEITDLIKLQGVMLSHEYFYSAIEKVISYMDF